MNPIKPTLILIFVLVAYYSTSFCMQRVRTAPVLALDARSVKTLVKRFEAGPVVKLPPIASIKKESPKEPYIQEAPPKGQAEVKRAAAAVVAKTTMPRVAITDLIGSTPTTQAVVTAQQQVESKQQKEWSFKAHECGVTALLRFSKNILITGGPSAEPVVKIWDIEAQKCIHELEGHERQITAIIKLSEATIASSSWDGTVRIWCINKGVCLKVIEVCPLIELEIPLEGGSYKTKTRGIVTALVKMSDIFFAAASSDKSITFWDAETGEACNKKFEGAQRIESILESPSLEEALAEAKRIREISATLGHRETVFSLAKISDTVLASGSADKTVKIWDLLNESACTRTLYGHEQAVNVVIPFSETCIAAASGDGNIRIWDCATGECIKSLVSKERNVVKLWAINCLLKLSETKLASGSIDGTIKLWDLETGKCIKVLHAHGGRPVTALVGISPTQFISSSKDGTVKHWDISAL